MPRSLFRFALPLAVLLAPEGDAGGAAGGGAPPPPPGDKGEKKADPPPPPPAADAKLAAELATTQAQLKALQEQARADAAARKQAEQKQLEEQGNFKTLAEQVRAENEALKKKLADLEGDATIGKTYREQQQKLIDEAAAKLVPEDKAVLDAIGTLDGKAAFLKRITAALGAAPAAKTPPGANTPPPGGTGPVDVAALIATKGMGFVEKHHPKELDAYLEAMTPKKSAKRSLF